MITPERLMMPKSRISKANGVELQGEVVLLRSELLRVVEADSLRSELLRVVEADSLRSQRLSEAADAEYLLNKSEAE